MRTLRPDQDSSKGLIGRLSSSSHRYVSNHSEGGSESESSHGQLSRESPSEETSKLVSESFRAGRVNVQRVRVHLTLRHGYDNVQSLKSAGCELMAAVEVWLSWLSG